MSPKGRAVQAGRGSRESSAHTAPRKAPSSSRRVLAPRPRTFRTHQSRKKSMYRLTATSMSA